MNTCYYFSGTGNSLAIATWIKSFFEKQGALLTLKRVGRDGHKLSDNQDLLHYNRGDLVIFCSPVHGFNYPPLMLNFIFKFPKGEADVYLLNTRAGMKLGRFVTPGLSGLTFYLSSLILRAKGYRIKGFIPFDMPSNWISLHPGLTDSANSYIVEKNRIKAQIKAKKIFNREIDFKSLFESPFDAVIAPISLLYFFIGRFFLSKSYIASIDCNSCLKCVNACPVEAIKIRDGKPYWTLKCESCMRCMSNCPKLAIETPHGAIALFSILFSFLSGRYFMHFFDSIDEYPLIVFLIKWSIYLIFYIGWYWLMHRLLKIKYVERFVVYTSLTKYKFWGRRYRADKYL